MKKKQEIIDHNPGFPRMETGYSVPEGYFESFGDRLKRRMDAEVRPQTSKKGIIFYLKPLIGIAASLLIILTVYVSLTNKQQEISYAKLQNDNLMPVDSRSETLSATLESQISEVGFFSAFTEMDEYDASKMPKEELADYLASRCSDLEILYASK